MNLPKTLRVIFCVLLVLLLLPVPAEAETAVEQERKVSLSIYAELDGVRLENARFQIYRVSEIGLGGELTTLPEFSMFSELLDIRGENAERWQAAALRLEQFLLTEGDVPPTVQGVTGKTGKVTFSEIPQGLYLVMGIRHKQNGFVYSTNPFFLQLPGKDLENGDWVYDVSANAKPSGSKETISLQAVKIWKDKFQETRRPESIQLVLYRDGKAYSTIRLPQNGRWEYQWENLEADHYWHVEEKPVSGYHSQVNREGNVFVVTNTARRASSGSGLPQTGLTWWPVPLLLSSGLGLILLGLLRRRRNHG